MRVVRHTMGSGPRNCAVCRLLLLPPPRPSVQRAVRAWSRPRCELGAAATRDDVAVLQAGVEPARARF